MLFVTIAIFICAATAVGLRRQLAGTGAIGFSGFTGNGVLAGFIIVFAGVIALGPQFGLPLLLALLLHELGQVLGYRIMGHHDARFRLVPCISTVGISDTPLATDGDVFMTSLLGPALNLVTMAVAVTLAAAFAGSQPALAHWLWLLATTIGAVNFVSLLPFLPMNGGRCVKTAVRSFWPVLAPAMTVFMSAAFASASLRTGSIILMVMAVIGASGLLRRSPIQRPAIPADAGLIALAAYVFTMAAHFGAGWLLFDAYF